MFPQALGLLMKILAAYLTIGWHEFESHHLRLFLSLQSGKNPAIQDWGIAGADSNKDDGNFTNWGMSLIKDLIFKGKKQKEKIDEDPTGKDAGDKGKIKGWFDDHPEIGKMQKDIFDDV